MQCLDAMLFSYLIWIDNGRQNWFQQRLIVARANILRLKAGSDIVSKNILPLELKY
jgi:hypothetical protein